MRAMLPLIGLALALAQMPASAADKAPISLAKASKWEINYDEDSCHLFARFGSGDSAALLALTRTSPSDWLEMSVFGEMLKFDGIAMPVEVAFGNQATPFKRTGVAITTGTNKLPGVIVEGLRLDGWDFPAKPKGPVVVPVLAPQTEAEVTSITLKRPGGKRYRLETGSLAAPMAAMRACTDDLLVHWGYDPKVEAGLTRQAVPIGNMGSWIRSEDFPEKALTRGHNGYVRFRLDVGPDGTVTGCRVLFRTNPDDFADHSCKLLMQRARMTPALDAAGKPVKSYYMSRIKWQAGDW